MLAPTLLLAAPPLLLLADPLPMVLWGLPRTARIRIGGWLVPRAPLRRTLAILTSMPVAWLVSALTVWLWHLPALYDAALEQRFVHDLEHLAFFGAGIIFWWPIIDPAPRLSGRASLSARVAYVVLAQGQQALLGLLLSMSPELLYRGYAARVSPSGLTALEDQARGGLVMWGLGGLVGMATVLVLLFRLLQQEERMGSPERSRLVEPRGQS